MLKKECKHLWKKEISKDYKICESCGKKIKIPKRFRKKQQHSIIKKEYDIEDKKQKKIYGYGHG